MKVLLSAYSCEPDRGSELGVGWNWALEMARLGHEVWVLTQTHSRAPIEAKLRQMEAPPSLHFIYYEPAVKFEKNGGQRFRIYLDYFFWQCGAYKLAREVHKREKFERVHHITWASIRCPSFMWKLGIPFVFGPVGGGESAPWRLRKGFGLRGWLVDAMRDISNWVIRLDPMMNVTFSKAHLILVATEHSRRIIPKKYWDKVRRQINIGVDNHISLDMDNGKEEIHQPFRPLFVGNFLYLKGMHLGLPAFAHLLERIPDARLTLVGQGPEEKSWRRLADRLNISHCIDWVSWMPQKDLANLYRSHDVLLFPTLRDSGGTVIFEAMMHGLPVICLDLGGPGEIVDNEIGRVVSTAGLSESQVALALAEAMIQFAKDPALQKDLQVNAKRKGKSLTWSSVVAQLYEEA